MDLGKENIGMKEIRLQCTNVVKAGNGDNRYLSLRLNKIEVE